MNLFLLESPLDLLDEKLDSDDDDPREVFLLKLERGRVCLELRAPKSVRALPCLPSSASASSNMSSSSSSLLYLKRLNDLDLDLYRGTRVVSVDGDSVCSLDCSYNFAVSYLFLSRSLYD